MTSIRLIDGIRISNLPPKRQKNIFDITGIKNKEVVNSRVLSYFLNPKEEHGLGTLFYDALLELIELEQKKCAHKPPVDLSLFNGEFVITEEEATNNLSEKDDKRKRIDLLLTGKDDWAIIIENKLYHDVINPLHSYWEHTRQRNKIGIILSLFKVEDKKRYISGQDMFFFNITHEDLIDSVSRSFRFTSDYNEISLFYLKEYSKTIKSHYLMKANIRVMNKIVNEIISQRKSINDILEKIKKSDEYILETIGDFFKKRDFRQVGARFIYNQADYIYFAVTREKIFSENTIVIILGTFTAKVDSELIKKMKDISMSVINDMDSKYMIENTYSGKHHTHITTYTNENFIGKDECFDVKFNQILNKFFFKPDGIIDRIMQLEREKPAANKA